MRDRNAPSVHEERTRSTRRRILAEATRLFARRGFHKTTVADLAAAIGMTQGALFHHFRGKRAVLEAVVDRLGRGFESYRPILSEDGELGVIVRRVAARMLDFYREQPEATVCLAALATEFAGTNDPILGKIRIAYDRFVDSFAARLSLEPKIRDPRASAIAFIAALDGLAVQSLLREGDPPPDALAGGLLNILNILES